MVAICQVVLRWSQEGRHQLSSNRKFTKHSWRNQLSTTILEQNVQHCRTDLLQVALCQHNIATPRHCRIGCSCNLVLYGSVRFWHLFCENPLLKIKRRFKTISSRKAKKLFLKYQQVGLIRCLSKTFTSNPEGATGKNCRPEWFRPNRQPGKGCSCKNCNMIKHIKYCPTTVKSKDLS